MGRQTAAGACLPHFEPSGCRNAAGAPLAQVFSLSTAPELPAHNTITQPANHTPQIC